MVIPNPGDKPSLLTHSDFFFLILLTISQYAQLFTLFTLRGNEVDTAQCRPDSASQCLTIPEEAGYQPAEQALLLFSRVFSNERSTKRAWSARQAPRVKACVTPLCLALLAPRTRKSVPHLRPANLSVIDEHHKVTVQHEREHRGILTDAFASLAFFKSSFANAVIAAFCVFTLGIRQASVSMLAFINVCV